MSNELLIEIGQLFISFLSTGTGICSIFYLISWVSNFFLSMVFPSRYGM